MDLTPYIPQIITAVATIGGVVLTLVFTGRRDSRKFASQMEFERTKLVHDHLRAACIQFLNALQTLEDAFYAMWHGDVDDRPIDEYNERRRQGVEALAFVGEELKLYAPSLSEHIDAARTWTDVMDDATSLTPDDLWHDHWVQGAAIRTDLQESMRRVLAISPGSGRGSR